MVLEELKKEYGARVDRLIKKNVFLAQDKYIIINALFSDAGRNTLDLSPQAALFFQGLRNDLKCSLEGSIEQEEALSKIINQTGSLSRFLYSEKEPASKDLIDTTSHED